MVLLMVLLRLLRLHLLLPLRLTLQKKRKKAGKTTQEIRPPLTMHVLDTALTRTIKLEMKIETVRSATAAHESHASASRSAAGGASAQAANSVVSEWVLLGPATTKTDGRLSTDLLPTGHTVRQSKTYRVTFDTGTYFRAQWKEPFYPEVTVVFTIPATGEHYHIPLLLSPFGYSTYRGS
jgi:5-hydroxyisourate hydrolase